MMIPLPIAHIERPLEEGEVGNALSFLDERQSKVTLP